jgi:hypothetical protein
MVPGIETDFGGGIGDDLDEEVGVPEPAGRGHPAGPIEHDQPTPIAVAPDDGGVPECCFPAETGDDPLHPMWLHILMEDEASHGNDVEPGQALAMDHKILEF